MVPSLFNTETVLKGPDSAGIGLCNTEENEEQEGRGLRVERTGPALPASLSRSVLKQINPRQGLLAAVRVVRAGVLTALFGAFPLAVASAQQAAPPVPQVVTTGRGEVEVKPDRAQVLFTVETRAASAAAAAADNGRRQRAVLDTLQRLGVAADQLQTANLQVSPEMVYPGQGLPPKVSGYVARNSVRVEVLKLEQTGILVDAGLAKGATGIGGLNFYSSKASEARRDALAKAVIAAKLDAEVMAKAAGYQLGALLEIMANAPPEEPMLMGMVMAKSSRLSMADAPTPVNPGEIKVVETVTVRWAIKM